MDNHFPEHLKKGKKIAIPKKGKDPSDPNNSRGIVISSQLGKAYEATIKTTNDISKSHHPLQFGFTKETAPQMATLCITESTAEAKSQGIPLFLIALDAKKAFDVVSHPILFRKLLTDGTPRETVASIMSLYTDATDVVLWDGATSDPYEVHQGVRQGGIISTDLYKLYIRDLLEKLQNTNLGLTIGSVHLAVAACADDIILISPSKHAIQCLLDEAVLFAKSHRYLLHPNKSVIASIRTKTPEDIKMYDGFIPTTEKLEHLGITRTLSGNNPMMKACVEDRINRMWRTAYLLMDVGLHGTNGLNPTASIKLIRTYILPRVLYGLEAVLLTRKEEDALETAYRKLLRQIQSLPQNTATEAIYLLAGCLPISAELDLQRLTLAGGVSRLPEENPLSIMARRQVELENPKSNSWFAQAIQMAERYGIDLQQNFLNPIPKEEWKKEINTRIKQHHQQSMISRAVVKSSMKHIDWSGLNMETPSPHRIWTDSGNDPATMHHAAYRAKMLTGGYLLQATVSKSSGGKLSPACQLCMQEDEEMVHLIWKCPVLEAARISDKLKIKEILTQMAVPLPTTPLEWTRLVLNGYPLLECSRSTLGNSLPDSTAPLSPSKLSVVVVSQGLTHKLSKTCSRMCTKIHELRTFNIKKKLNTGETRCPC